MWTRDKREQDKICDQHMISNTKMETLECDPQTKQDWSALLAYLYQQWRKARLPVTYCPTIYARGSLRLDGIIGGKSIGQLVH